MKLIYVLILTTTTMFDGHPLATEVAAYDDIDKCFYGMEQIVKKYKETFPEGSVHIVQTDCEPRMVPNRYKWHKPK